MHEATVFSVVCAELLGLALLLPRTATAWPDNPNVNVPLCTAAGMQGYPLVVSDSAGGAIVAWLDLRTSLVSIYARRISATGTASWQADGVPLCTVGDCQEGSGIVPDGVSGVIGAWTDYRINGPHGDGIYAQQISDAGTGQWGANGMVVCSAAGMQGSPIAASDDTGGVIVTWQDQRSDGGDVYAQRISGVGAVHWPANGVALCSAAGTQYWAPIISDGAGGAIGAWQDERNDVAGDIYAQRVWADGSVPVLLSLVRADVTADAINLTWLAGGSGSGAATVHRSSVAGEWTRVGEVTADGTGYLRYTDPIDATATRVGYRLGIVDAGVEGFYGETWVDLPARDASLTFALDPVRPNPSQGGALTVRFTLPSAAPARVELVDVSGRRVADREVGSLGAGPHALDLGEGQHLAPGLYLVRLTQGTNTRVTRVAVL